MRFNYQARTKDGEIQSGTIEASNREVAANTLQRHGLVVVHIEAASAVPFYARSLKIFQKVKIKELVLFYRQLSILFEADIPLLDALKAVAQQTRNAYFRDILFEVETDVKGGESFSKALAKHSKVFSSFYINVIQSGEVTGKLSEILKYLADHAEEEFLLNSKIKSAFTYPIFIFSVFIVVGVLMLVYVVPQLTIVLLESGQELPLPTKILVATSNFFRSWSWLLFIVVTAAIFGFIRFKKTTQGKEMWDKLKLKFPALGKFLQKIYIARFSENFSTLLKGGLPILSALKISGQVIGNTVFTQLIEEAREKVKTGETISSVFEKSKQIPSLVVQMLKVGERTAKLDEILKRVAKYYRGEIERVVSNLTQIIEPFLIVVLGGAVAFLVAAILLPIYNISGGF